MPFSTRDGYFSLTPQTEQGLVEGVAPERFQFVRFLGGHANSESEHKTILDPGGQPDTQVKTKEVVRGEIVANARPDICAALFQFVPGSPSWNLASAPARHTFVTGAATHAYATIQHDAGATSSALTVGDAFLTGLKIEAQSGAALKLTVPFVGLQPLAGFGSAVAPSYAAEAPFLFYSAPSITVDGVGDTSIDGFTLDLSISTRELSANAVTPDAVVMVDRDLAFSFSRRYQNSSLWRKIAYGGGITPTQSVATGSFGAYFQYGSGASLRSLQLDLPLLVYQGDTLTELDPNGRTVYETVSAVPISAGTWAAILGVRNSHASTYGSVNLPYPDSPDSYPGRFFPAP